MINTSLPITTITTPIDVVWFYNDFYDLFGKFGDMNVTALKFQVSAPPELLAPSTSNIHSAQGCLMASTKYQDSNTIVTWHNKTSFLFISIIPAQSLMWKQKKLPEQKIYINPSGGLPVSATKANLAQRKMMQRSLSANQIGESSFCHFED